MGDVAKLAGVSHQTVSRVLNNHPNVSSETKERVESAIASLGYRRNTAARSLVTRRSRTIGVLACETGQYGPANTLLGVEQAGREAGYFVSIANLREVTGDSINDAIAHFRNESVEGVVILVPHPDVLAAFRDVIVPFPMVAVGAGTGNELTGASLNQRLGARLAVEHLIGLGHRHIGHISGPTHWIDAAERIKDGRRHSATRAWRPTFFSKGDGMPPRDMKQAWRSSNSASSRISQLSLLSLSRTTKWLWESFAPSRKPGCGSLKTSVWWVMTINLKLRSSCLR